MIYDIAVIGGGVIGALCARELSKYNASVVVLEKGDDVACGATRANSGIVHAGFDAIPGTLKAKFNVLGNLLMPKLCSELGVRYKNNGSLVIDYEGNADALNALYHRGVANGVNECSIISEKQLKQLEPNVHDSARGALYAKSGGIVCPYNLAISAIGNAMDNGVELIRQFELTRVERCADGVLLISERGESVKAQRVLNCAGSGSERVAKLFGDDSFSVGYRLGEYMLLDKSASGIVNHTLFSLPTRAGKGVLVSPTVDGNVLVGPTSVESEFYDNSIRREGFEDIRQKADKMVKNIPYGATITSFAGVRAYCDRHDFIIEQSKACERLFNVAGIESPGLTSAPAIGKYVAEHYANALRLSLNKSFNPTRQSVDFYKQMPMNEKNEYIKAHPEFGKIVCRCEGVSLGEILFALKQNPKPTTLDGIKLRTRAGMGRCQSGFCQPNVLSAIAEENGLALHEIKKGSGNSFVLTGGKL